VVPASKLILNIRDGRLHASEFRRTPNGLAVLASTTLGGRYKLVRWGAQLKALMVFLLEQASWAVDDRITAASEIALTIGRGGDTPATAPLFAGPSRSVVATLAEALKAKRSDAVHAVFGDWFFVEDAFGKRLTPPSVWLNVRHLSPTDFQVIVDGELQENPAALRKLALEIERSRPGAWTTGPREILAG
jgi:hypothetical protein